VGAPGKLGGFTRYVTVKVVRDAFTTMKLLIKEQDEHSSTTPTTSAKETFRLSDAFIRTGSYRTPAFSGGARSAFNPHGTRLFEKDAIAPSAARLCYTRVQFRN